LLPGQNPVGFAQNPTQNFGYALLLPSLHPNTLSDPSASTLLIAVEMHQNGEIVTLFWGGGEGAKPKAPILGGEKRRGTSI